MKFPPYPKYKPSGVEWLGDVPEHWEVVPFKHRCRRFAIYGANISSDEYVPDGVRFLRTTDIDDFGHLQSEGVFIEPEQAREYLLNDQDILLSRSGTLGRAFIYSAKIHPACAYAGYLVRFIPSPRLNPRFLFHFTKSLPFAEWLQTQLISSTIGNVNGQKYAQCPLPLPERPEQDTIAAFLDRETGRLDRLVGRKRELIERLKEKRTALISRTVTRGLPPAAARAAGLPDLSAEASAKEENPPLKPSGLPWLGDIPKHWDTVPVRYAFYNLDHRRIPVAGEDRANVEKIYPYYGASGIIDYVEDFLFDETLILVAEDGANLLSRSTPLAFLASGKYWVNNHAHILKPVAGDIRYWAAVLQTYDYTPLVTGAAQPKLTSERLGSIRLPKPPPDEQAAIAAYLDQETAKLDALVAKVEAAIERLQEYRTALITAAVTGKIDVRKHAMAAASSTTLGG